MKRHLLLSTLLISTAHAGRSSADYAITTDTFDFGGQRVASASYSIQGSVTSITGISENPSPVSTVARHGYIGQLYDVLGFGILFTDSYPPEDSTTQVIPVRATDDGTYLTVPLNEVIYTALNGPVSSISPTGLITTSTVDEETPAMIRGTLAGVGGASAELQIFVQDMLPDNFGTYAGDGLPDSWQRTHFGQANPLAAPLLDPDGDGQNNRFEYIAGILPNDPLSRFLLRIEPIPGEPSHKALKFSPVLPDRSYTVKSNTTLSGVWENLTDFTDDNQQPERSVTDRAATDPTKFYEVEITKP